MNIITLLTEATFLVTRVSDKKHNFTKNRKDTGEEFTTQEWALTLYPTRESGFSTDYSWTIWTSNDEVAELARTLIKTPELVVNNEDGSVQVIRQPRLALLNSARDFAQGDIKPNQNPDYPDNCSVWLKDKCEPDFGVVEMPRAKGSGNIRELKSLLGVNTAKPEKAESVKPADGGDAPF